MLNHAVIKANSARVNESMNERVNEWTKPIETIKTRVIGEREKGDDPSLHKFDEYHFNFFLKSF
jgi:hypothetical protein